VQLAPILSGITLSAVLVLSWPFRGPRLLPDPPAIDGPRATLALVFMAATILFAVVGLIAGFASLISRLRTAAPIERAQVKWFLFGAAAAFALDLVGDLGHAVAPLRLAAVGVCEMFILVAIERYHLWEIDRLINRTVVYGILTIGAGMLYASAAISIGLVAGGAGTQSPLAVAGATLLTAVLFAPTRRRTQRTVDRIFDRRTFDAVSRVRVFAERLGHDTPDPAELQALLADVLRDPDLVVCFATSDGGLIDCSGAAMIPPAEGAGRAVALLGSVAEPIAIVGYRRTLNDEGRLLGDVLRTARSPLEHARLQAELRVQLVAIEQSRIRLVEATDAERRRIERDLHDGAQQRLIALALRVRTEQHRGAVERGSNLDRLLSAMVDELQAAVAELRAMTHGMLPPALTSGGAAPALRELVSRYDGKVRLLGVPSHRHAPIVEATAWFVASEGLTNATKHAANANVTVHADCDEGVLRVAVCDDGPGGATFAESGLQGLFDRVVACQGTLTLNSPAGGGTELTAVLPCG
jgi:signal transduction histidine kinase